MAGINFIKKAIQDTARANRFTATILPPNRLAIYAPFFLKMIVLVKSTQLPARGFLTTEIRNYGPIDKRPYSPLYDNITVVFTVDKDYDSKRIMDAWYDLIYDENNNIFEYPEGYESTMIIEGSDRVGFPKYAIEINGIFPTQIGPVDLSSESSDQSAEFSVTFQFKSWKPIIPLELGAAISAGSLLKSIF